MALEAQEVAVRLRLLGGTAFQAEADRSAASIRNVGKAGEEVNAASATGGLPGFLAKSGKSLDAVNGKLDRFSKKSLQVGRETAVLSAGAGALIYFSVKEAAQAESQFKLLETQAHATRTQRHELEATVPQFGKLGVAPKELAEGYYPLQSVFHNVTQDVKAMDAAIKGAKTGHDTLLHTTEALTGGFKVGFKDIHSYAEEMSLLDETVGAGKMHLPELHQTFTTPLYQTAKALGLEQRDIFSLLASASQTTGAGGVQSYSSRLSTALLKGTTLKGQAAAAGHRLGFGKNTIAEDFQKKEGLLVMLRQLKAGEDKLGDPIAAKRDITEMFGNARSAGTILTALQRLKTAEEIRKRLDGVSGTKTLDTHFKQNTETMQFQFEKLKATIHDLLYEMGKFFGPYVLKGLTVVAKALGGLVTGFKGLPQPVKVGIGVFIALVAVMSPIAFLLAGMSAGLRLLLSPLAMVVRGFGGLGPAVKGGAVAMEAEAGAFRLTGGMFAGALIAGFAGGLILSKTDILHKILSSLGLVPSKVDHTMKEVKQMIATGHTKPFSGQGSGYAFGQHPEFEPKGAHRYKVVKPSAYGMYTDPTSGRSYFPGPGEKAPAGNHGPPVKIEIVLHHTTTLDGQKIGENKKVVQGVERKQREHQNRR